MSSAKRYLRKILFFQGIITLVFSATWIWDYTPGRLQGVGWLTDILDWSPVSTDDTIGILWALSALVMIAAGSRLGAAREWLESMGVVVGISIPLFVGLIFIAAFFTGGAPNGYIVLISYTIFASPYVAYLRMKPHELSDSTGTFDVVGDAQNE